MRIKIINLGGISQEFIRDGIDYYIKKINAFNKCELIIPKIKIKYSSIDERLKKEADYVLSILKDEYLVVADSSGKVFKDSIDFSKEFNKILNSSKDIVFLIGSDNGFSNLVKKRANLVFSFSNHTFNHELANLILVEIIYRSFAILKNHPYHK